MAKLITLSLLAVLLYACSSTSTTAQGGRGESYAARMSPAWDEWARENNGGPN
jgi:uncharacterized lipoprotein